MSGYQIPHFGLKRQYNNLKDELLEATHEALSEGCLVNGPFTKKFEYWLQYRCGTKYAITVHSGTQALEIIARYKKEKHNKVLAGVPTIRLPNLTYPATLNAFLNSGWNVILDDTDKYGILRFEGQTSGDYNCLVGLYGKMPWEQARIETSYGIIVDGAQHWLVCNGQVGSGMAISFDPTKNLNSSGNGGAIVTNDIGLYEYAYNYRDNMKPNFWEYGTNSKMSEQDCAQILVRTNYIKEWQLRRKAITEYYIEHLSNLPIKLLADTVAPHAYQKFVIYTSDRTELHTYLMREGIQSKISYEYTLGDLPVAKNLPRPDMLSTSVMLSRGVLGLPIYPELTDNEVDYIIEKVKAFYA